MQRQILLYGILGAEDQYRVAKYWVIFEQSISIEAIVTEAERMRIEYPSIQHVYALDNRYGLRREYYESVKENSIESCLAFKDTLEREGLRIF